MNSIFKYYNPHIHFEYGDGSDSVNDKNKVLNYLKRYHIITECTYTGPTKVEYNNFQSGKTTKYLTPLSNYLKSHGMNVSVVTTSVHGPYDMIQGLYDTDYFKDSDNGFKKATELINKIAAWDDAHN